MVQYRGKKIKLFKRDETVGEKVVQKVFIITGATGFLGNNIIRKLNQDGESEIRALVLKDDPIKSLENLKFKKEKSLH